MLLTLLFYLRVKGREYRLIVDNADNVRSSKVCSEMFQAGNKGCMWAELSISLPVMTSLKNTDKTWFCFLILFKLNMLKLLHFAFLMQTEHDVDWSSTSQSNLVTVDATAALKLNNPPCFLCWEHVRLSCQLHCVSIDSLCLLVFPSTRGASDWDLCNLFKALSVSVLKKVASNKITFKDPSLHVSLLMMWLC